MTAQWQLALLSEEADGARVLTCAERASDYIQLETGRVPDAIWVQGFFNDIPPGRTKEDILMFGIEQPDGRLSGLLGMAPGYETATEWYIGLLLIAEAERGAGMGHAVMDAVKSLAKSAGAETLKLAVLVKNPDAIRFWEREGFVKSREAADDGTGDGHDRVVMQLQL